MSEHLLGLGPAAASALLGAVAVAAAGLVLRRGGRRR
jgi:hypothetical protein